jgi:hypothetical protein
MNNIIFWGTMSRFPLKVSRIYDEDFASIIRTEKVHAKTQHEAGSFDLEDGGNTQRASVASYG